MLTYRNDTKFKSVDEMCLEAARRQVWVVNETTGAVFSNRKRILVGCQNKHGYLVATLWLDDVRKQVKLHRFVWMATHQQLIPSGLLIDHINGQKDDNRPENLRLADAQLNAMNRRDYSKANNPFAKITQSVADAVRAFYGGRDKAKTRHGRSYKTTAEKFNISATLVAKIVRGEVWI